MTTEKHMTDAEQLAAAIDARLHGDAAPKRTAIIAEVIASRTPSVDALVEALEGSKVALAECANIIRPTLPSLAENVIGAHLRQIDAALTNYRKAKGER